MMKIGIVGTGFMGQVHARSWENTPMKVYGVYSRTPSKTQDFAQAHEIKHFDSMKALCDAVDVVDICTPTHTHMDLIRTAVEANCHIVCEKPIARTLEQAETILSSCADAGVYLLIAHVLRFFPEYRSAKVAVERGEIENVGVMRLKRAAFPPQIEWYHDFAQSGGIILDLLIHDFDYVRWVAGDVSSVYAKIVSRQQSSGKGEYALVILKHNSGAISYIEGGSMYPSPVFRTSFEIAGENGLITYQSDATQPIEVLLHRDSDDQSKIGRPQSPLIEDPYTSQLKHFSDILIGKAKNPIVTPHSSFSALKIALAAIESAQSGQRVSI